MKNQLLLLEDVANLGRKGDVVTAKPGFVRNFLLPKKKAVIASKETLRIRERLQEERAKQAAVDKEESLKLSKIIEGKTLEITVKVDNTGHLYGSVSASDVVELFSKEGLDLEKNNVILPAPLKKLGNHIVELKLKEGVPASVTVKVKGETMRGEAFVEKKQEEKPQVVASEEVEAKEEDESSE